MLVPLLFLISYLYFWFWFWYHIYIVNFLTPHSTDKKCWSMFRLEEAVLKIFFFLSFILTLYFSAYLLTTIHPTYYQTHIFFSLSLHWCPPPFIFLSFYLCVWISVCLFVLLIIRHLVNSLSLMLFFQS